MSHPVRVRGLKPFVQSWRIKDEKSHPVRVRGLKHSFYVMIYGNVPSHPVRVRGLKPFVQSWRIKDENVAPRAGAWIETSPNKSSAVGILVAPRAGAWIETPLTTSNVPINRVAPRAGAWIETASKTQSPLVKKSHPVRVRGLKLSCHKNASLPLCRTPCGCVD